MKTEENENVLLEINDVYSLVSICPLKMMIYKRGLRSEAACTDGVEGQDLVF